MKDQTVKGADVVIIKESTYELEARCNYSLENYPFDVQKCHLEFVPDLQNRSAMIIQPSLVENFLEFHSYTIIHMDWQEKYEGYQRIRFNFIINRNTMSHYMQNFIPITILLTICQVTNYFLGPDSFDTVISVNATVLMTLASLIVESFASTPSTNHTK